MIGLRRIVSRLLRIPGCPIHTVCKVYIFNLLIKAILIIVEFSYYAMNLVNALAL